MLRCGIVRSGKGAVKFSKVMLRHRIVKSSRVCFVQQRYGSVGYVLYSKGMVLQGKAGFSLIINMHWFSKSKAMFGFAM